MAVFDGLVFVGQIQTVEDKILRAIAELLVQCPRTDAETMRVIMCEVALSDHSVAEGTLGSLPDLAGGQ